MALTFVNQIGAVEGLNQAAPGTLIPDSFVRWSQDILFDRAGLIRRRGPFSKFKMLNNDTTVNTDGLFTYSISGVTDERIISVLATYDPTGAERIGMLVDSYNRTTNTRETILRVFDRTFKFLGYEKLPFVITPLSIVSHKPALGGGLWISVADIPSDSDTHYQFFWRGGYNSDMTIRSGSFAAATLQGSGISGSSASTNDWANLHEYYSKTIAVTSSGLAVGMFVYVKSGTNYYYVGTISSIQDASNIVLEKHPFIWDASYDNNKNFSTVSKDLVFVSVRPYEHVHGRGLLNTTYNNATITSGTIGTSAEGHWKSANVGASFLYRSSDNICLGKVSYTTNNETAILVADPGIDIKADEYIMKKVANTALTSPSAFQVSNRDATTFSGLYTAVYAGYQWYGNFANDDQNTNRVVFSAAHDREAVDLSLDAADSIIFPGKSSFRGLGASSTGLLVFLEDRTYILRGNDRSNFSVEQLVPEGCLCASSIVEYGGGVFWAGKSGIMFYDGASVRNLTKDNLGLYYTDSLDVFNPIQDRVIGFMHKNNLIMHYTSWKSPFDPIRYEPLYAADRLTTPGMADRTLQDFADSGFTYDDLNTQNNVPIFWDQKILNNPEESASTGVGFKWNDGTNWETTINPFKWGPLRAYTSLTFSIYMPTNALTTLANLDFRGMTSIETLYGLKTIVGVNSVENISNTNRIRARLIDIHPVYDTNANGQDELLIEKINIPVADLIQGPDFYLQTKHYTVGDPILRKWFRKVMLSMLLYDGAIRMDLVDDDDNDSVDINAKKHRYWDIFTELGYDWDYLDTNVFPKITSPNKSTWQNVEGSTTLWDEVFTANFNRYVKRISWRNSSVGFRLYQLNNYKKPYNGTVTRPTRVEMQGFTIGFNPLRAGRV